MAWRYGWFAERYHWTPEQVDAQPLWVINHLPIFARAVEEARSNVAEREEARARAQSRG